MTKGFFGQTLYNVLLNDEYKWIRFLFQFFLWDGFDLVATR